MALVSTPDTSPLIAIDTSGVAWLGFWLFLCVIVLVDAWLYQKGYKNFLFEDRTDDEKARRSLQTRRLLAEVELLEAQVQKAKKP